MADDWKLSTVTADIADQSISVKTAKGKIINVPIRDIDNVPFVVEEADCPLLAPRPDDFITPLGTFFKRASYGADAAKKDVTYTLHYKFYFAPALQGADTLTNFGDSVNALVAIALHFFTHTDISGSTEFIPRIENFLPQTDGAGTVYHGGQIAFDVLQYLET